MYSLYCTTRFIAGYLLFLPSEVFSVLVLVAFRFPAPRAPARAALPALSLFVWRAPSTAEVGAARFRLAAVLGADDVTTAALVS